jgi:hypothetical protein
VYFIQQPAKISDALKRPYVRLFYYLAMHKQPFTLKMMVDYGLLTAEHEAAVRHVIQTQQVPAVIWEDYCGNGVELTRCLKDIYPNLEFVTASDYLTRRRALPFHKLYQTKMKTVLHDLLSSRRGDRNPLAT